LGFKAAFKAIKAQIEASQGMIRSVFLVGGYAASPWLFGLVLRLLSSTTHIDLLNQILDNSKNGWRRIKSQLAGLTLKRAFFRLHHHHPNSSSPTSPKRSKHQLTSLLLLLL
jgi:hypothetical protein